MITATILKKSDVITGVSIFGHAKYDEYGQDIVCASVSVLAINMANSIEKFTSDSFDTSVEEESGAFTFLFTSEISDDSKLLIHSFLFGLEQIQESYGEDYIKIKFKEV